MKGIDKDNYTHIFVIVWYNGIGDTMSKTTLAVKDLIHYVFASGNLDFKQKNLEAKYEGQRLHMKHQSDYHKTDEKEVFIQCDVPYKEERFELSGRIDGVLKRLEKPIIEEIKTTETDLSLITEKTYPAHLAQAKVYAYMFMNNNNLADITLRLTYIHRHDHTKKTIEQTYTKETLKAFLDDVIAQYLRFHRLYQQHLYDKEITLEGLEFPYPTYRQGQEEFMAAIYKTMITEDILYAQAPTGIGKTIAALYASLKTLKNDQEKIFYCSAKNAGKTIAVDTMRLLKNKGLKIKAITLNAKDDMCLREEVDCDPEICPFAKGFYNRLNKALEDIFVHDDVYHLELMMQYGRYHDICPHEFALEISRYCDVIICDYNYVFDPNIQLIRYFDETISQPKLLVDEAHNLVDRSRQMHSATLSLNTLKHLKEDLKQMPGPLLNALNALIGSLEMLMGEKAVKKSGFVLLHSLDQAILQDLQALLDQMEGFLMAYKQHKKRKIIREHYLEHLSFFRISEYFNADFRVILTDDDEDLKYHMVCLDASFAIKELIDSRVKASVFFSATLSPNAYFSALLTQGTGQKFEIPTPFNPKHLGLFIDVSTSTKYRQRQLSVTRIIDNIYALLESKVGHYIIFFPSYAYMNLVLEAFDAEGYDLYIQKQGMNFLNRQKIISAFKTPNQTTKVLFSVLGGSFSEGIDYVGNMLDGVMIVGVALPQYNTFNEILKDHYMQKGYDGFHYAYTYPGMNKVIQAVGRVIRRTEDVGVAVLLDQRYQTPIYQSLMPIHWSHAEYLEEDDYLQGYLKQFWRKHVKK